MKIKIEKFKEIVARIADFEDGVSYEHRVQWIADHPNNVEIAMEDCNTSEQMQEASFLKMAGSVNYPDLITPKDVIETAQSIMLKQRLK